MEVIENLKKKEEEAESSKDTAESSGGYNGESEEEEGTQTVSEVEPPAKRIKLVDTVAAAATDCVGK